MEHSSRVDQICEPRLFRTSLLRVCLMCVLCGACQTVSTQRFSIEGATSALEDTLQRPVNRLELRDATVGEAMDVVLMRRAVVVQGSTFWKTTTQTIADTPAWAAVLSLTGGECMVAAPGGSAIYVGTQEECVEASRLGEALRTWSSNMPELTTSYCTPGEGVGSCLAFLSETLAEASRRSVPSRQYPEIVGAFGAGGTEPKCTAFALDGVSWRDILWAVLLLSDCEPRFDTTRCTVVARHVRDHSFPPQPTSPEDVHPDAPAPDADQQ